MTLGDHLSAEEYIVVSFTEIVYHSIVGLLSACGVGIHSHHAHIGKIFGEGALDLLRAVAKEGEVVGRAGGTLTRCGLGMSAEVTKKLAAACR